jgi:uncharacterized membrane protein YfhO
MIKPGEHTIKYSYSPKGLKAGCAISAASLVYLCAYVFYKKSLKNKSTSNNDNLVKS